MYKRYIIGAILISIAANLGNCNKANPLFPDRGLNKLRISEIHYHPRKTDSLDEGNFEFIELFNASESTIKLNTVAFTDGIEYTFADTANIPSGAFIVLAENTDHFFTRYGKKPDGVYTGKLNNKGETIVLADVSIGARICSISYTDTVPWPLAANGYGFSLVPLAYDCDENNPENWTISSTIHGSPWHHDPIIKPDFISWK